MEITNESGCFNTSNIRIVFVNCTGIDKVSSINLINYPNPTSGIFKIELKSDINKYVDISILNTTGAVIYKLDNIYISGSYTQDINISNFADGVYTIVISNNEKSTSQKIILRK